MKTPLLAISSVLALAVSAWCAKHLMDTRAAATPVSAQHPTPSKTEGLDAGRTPPAENLQPSRDAAESTAAATAAPTPAPARFVAPQGVLQTPRSAPSQNPPLNAASPVAFPAKSYAGQSATISSSRSLAQPAASGGASATTANSSNATPANAASASRASAVAAASSIGNAAASNPDAGALELDPGVPVPAALLTSGENQSPTVAAAQQQLADSFVENVNAALSQPATANNDAAATEAYYDALTRANEQYRALYGDAAYSQKTMQATLEAQAGK